MSWFTRVVVEPVGRALVGIGARLRTGSKAGGEQLLSIVDEAVEQDAIEDDETQELIHSVFEFGDTVAREVMVPRPDMVTVEGDMELEDAIDVIIEHGVSRVPVVGEDVDDILGVLYLKDVVRARRRGDPRTTARELARPAVLIPESQKVDELLRRMQLERFHIALVVDEYGGIAGLVTLEDVIEELVGDISDEHDRRGSDVVDLGDGSYRVAARYNIEDLGEIFGIEIEDDEVDSVGGLLTKAHGDIPLPGTVVEVDGLRLVADRFERGRLKTVVASRTERLAAAEEAFPPVKVKERR
jgi:CBS domain containing-hemolysin-like protein